MDFEYLTYFHLEMGDHESPEQGLCAMEAVAWLEGLPHTDQPACTCPVIAAFVREVNDTMPDRQLLIPYLPRLIDTVDAESEMARAEFLVGRALRVYNNADSRRDACTAKVYLRSDSPTAAVKCVCSCIWWSFKHLEASGGDIEGFWRTVLDTLDGVLAIGKQAPPLAPTAERRVKEYRALVEAS